VANFSSGTVVKFVGSTPSTFASFGSQKGPTGLAFDSAGNLYVSLNIDNTIREVTPSGVVSTFASTDLNRPKGLAFDASGNLYASNFNTIEKFTPAGVPSLFANSGLSVPLGLAFDTLGNLYVANQGNHTIEKFTSGGVGSLFADRLHSPNYLAFEVPEPSAAALALAAMPIPLLRRRRRVAARC
jgi:sugar lactone lactonase YvrE